MKIKEYIFLGASLTLVSCTFTTFMMLYSGQLDSYVIWFMLCSGLPGLALLIWGVSKERTDSLIGNPKLQLPQKSFLPGDLITFDFQHRFPQKVILNSIDLRLVLRETAVNTSGSTNTIKTHDNLVQSHSIASGDFHKGEVITKTCNVHIPANSMHTLLVPYNKLQWYVQLKFNIPNLPDFVAEEEVIIKPTTLP